MADACAGPAAYRPRQARDSPLYRLAEIHHETFKQVYDERFATRYGAWRGVVERTLFAFLDLHALVSAGVFGGEGVFTPLPLPPVGVAEELFRRRVIRMLVRRGRSRRTRPRGCCRGDTPASRCTTPSGWSLTTRRGSSGCAGTWCIRRSTPGLRERRRQWARLIARVFEVDPLRCVCGGTMRVVGFILDPAVIRKILEPRPRPEARAHAPPGG